MKFNGSGLAQWQGIGHNEGVETAETPANPPPPPPLPTFFRLWFFIGLQSFGGGTATNALIRRVAVEEQKWMTEEEFALESALCPLVPGMNLLALTGLIGQRVAGLPGVTVALLGLLLPSVSMTLIITAGFASVRNIPAIQAAVTNGIVPATVGIGLWTTYLNGRALLLESKRENAVSFLFSLLLLGVALALSVRDALPIFALLMGGGAMGAIFTVLNRRGKPETEGEAE